MAAVVLEILLRAFAPQPLGMSYRTPEGLTLHIPGARVRYARQEFDHSIEINSLGLRDREYAVAKPEGVLRILVLGDSYAEGSQVRLEETFAKRLETALAARFSRPRFEVWNGGVAGYGTAHEIAFFEHYGRSLAPDVVILAFSAGNDVLDNASSKFFRWEDGTLRELPLERPAPLELRSLRVKEFLASRFHVYQFLRDRVHHLRGLGQPARPERLRSHRTDLLAPGSDASDSAWQLTEALLDRLQQEVAAAGAGLLLIAIPMRLQVDDAEWTAFSASAGAPLERDALQRRLATYARERGTPFLDLLPALRDANRIEPAYYRIDAHFNARGHEIAAREILEALVRHGMVPAAVG